MISCDIKVLRIDYYVVCIFKNLNPDLEHLAMCDSSLIKICNYVYKEILMLYDITILREFSNFFYININICIHNVFNLNEVFHVSYEKFNPIVRANRR